MSLVYTPQCTTALLRHFSMYNDLGAECTSLMVLWIVYPVPKEGKTSVSRACIRWVVPLCHSASRSLTSPSNLTSSLAYVQHNTHLVIDDAHPTGIYLLEAARYFRYCQCTYTGSGSRPCIHDQVDQGLFAQSHVPLSDSSHSWTYAAKWYRPSSHMFTGWKEQGDTCRRGHCKGCRNLAREMSRIMEVVWREENLAVRRGFDLGTFGFHAYSKRV